VHDPGQVVADLAASVAPGGDCLADIALLREEPDLAGPVASDPVVSRLVATLGRDLPRSLPLSGFAQNQVWCEIAALACELLAWTQGSPSPALPAAGNPSDYGCACSRSPVVPPAAAADISAATARLQAIRDRLTSPDIPSTRKEKPPGPVEPRPPAATAGQPSTA